MNGSKPTKNCFKKPEKIGSKTMKLNVMKNILYHLILWGMIIMNNSVYPDTGSFTIVDDPQISAIVAKVRSDFLLKHPYMSRLDSTILIPGENGTWRRGSYNPEVIAYPASCVKLAYLACAMYWCRINGHPYNYLENNIQPMIVHSDNPATGRVFDAITGAPNYQTSVRDQQFDLWYQKRLFTENYLKSRGLLENQTVMHKTYPSNSGESPNGGEKVALDLRNGNRMQPKCSASLMLEIVKGAIEPEANEYMRKFLRRERWDKNSEFGFGLPPGSSYENKYGQAYDTLEDIAYIMLPNGREFILSAFSNGYVEPEISNPSPYNVSLLGGYCEMLIEALGLDQGCPPKIKIDNSDPDVSLSGDWSIGNDPKTDYDKFGTNYLYATADTEGSKSVTWHLKVPVPGLYEVCVWYPQKKSGGMVSYTVNHTTGAMKIDVNQRVCGGRWRRLGDFGFRAGEGSVVLTNLERSLPNQIITADAVKITKWPEKKISPE
jgi:protein phosphatase methylesterase 1